jgi:hypothetical protein
MNYHQTAAKIGNAAVISVFPTVEMLGMKAAPLRQARASSRDGAGGGARSWSSK